MSYVPIKDAKVTIRNESLVKIAEGYTNENGTVKFNLLKGRYNISVEKEGYQKHEQWIDLLSNLTKEVVLEKIAPPTTEPSGIDPNDPTWCPPEGWTKIWKFLTEDELEDFTQGDYYYAYVENGLLKFDSVTSGYAYAEREIYFIYAKRVAICFRINIKISNVIYGFLLVRSENGTIGRTASLYTVSGDTSKIELYASISQDRVVFNNPNDFIVLVYDYDERKTKVYDKNKNLLAEVTMGDGAVDVKKYWIQLLEYTESDCEYDLEVDWVAIQEAQ